MTDIIENLCLGDKVKALCPMASMNSEADYDFVFELMGINDVIIKDEL